MLSDPITAFTVYFFCFRQGQRRGGSDELCLDHGVDRLRRAAQMAIHHPRFGRIGRVYSSPNARAVRSASCFLGEALTHDHPKIDSEHPAFNLEHLSEADHIHLEALEFAYEDAGDRNQRWRTTQDLIDTFALCRELRGQLRAGLLAITRELSSEVESKLPLGRVLRDLPERERQARVLAFGPSPFLELAAPVPFDLPKLMPGAGVLYTAAYEYFPVGHDWHQRFRITRAEHLPALPC